MGTLANSVDTGEMEHHAAFHLGQHCLLRLKQHSGTKIHHNLEVFTCHPLKYKIDNSIFFVSICMGKSTKNSKG